MQSEGLHDKHQAYSKPFKAPAKAVEWRDDQCVLLDQTRLPAREDYLSCKSSREVAQAIRDLAVRGAPAIGVAAAYGVVLAAREALRQSLSEQRGFFESALDELAAARPTAVNLRWAVDALRAKWKASDYVLDDALASELLISARKIHDDDIESNRRMGVLGASLLPADCEVMTYCNTGDLATGGIGTAFGVFAEGFRQGKVRHVYTCETRPVLQGLRLTAWELHRNEIPFTSICDNMAATVMRSRPIGAVIVGADRIAANGDVANKIGTYGLAVLARYHSVPFLVAAPYSTFDPAIRSGEDIPIEERRGDEIVEVLGANRPPFAVPTYNPAFDVTPHSLIRAIVCEHGILESPNPEVVGRLHRQLRGVLV